MAIDVFDVPSTPPQSAYQPLIRFRMRAATGGFELFPHGQKHTYGSLAGLAIFTKRERDHEELYVLLSLRGQAQPFLLTPNKIELDAFPIERTHSSVSNVRLLGRLLCQQAGDLTIDRATADFLEGQVPRSLPCEIVELATALGQRIAPEAVNAPPTPPAGDDDIIPLAPRVDAPPAAPPQGGDVYQGDVDQGDVYQGDLPQGAPYQTAPNPGASTAGHASVDANAAGRPSDPASAPINPYANPKAKAPSAQQGLSMSAFVASFFYPLRGFALIALIILTIVPLIPIIGALISMVVLPTMIFEVIRETARGGDRLSQSPQFGGFFRHVGEILCVFAAGIVPSILFNVLGLLVAGVGLTEVHPLLGVAWALLIGCVCICLWLMTAGAIAIYERWTLAFRPDLHIRAFLMSGRPALIFLLQLFLLGVLVLLAGQAAFAASAATGFLVAFMAAPFLMLASVHFVGLLYRQRRENLNWVYL